MGSPGQLQHELASAWSRLAEAQREAEDLRNQLVASRAATMIPCRDIPDPPPVDAKSKPEEGQLSQSTVDTAPTQTATPEAASDLTAEASVAQSAFSPSNRRS